MDEVLFFNSLPWSSTAREDATHELVIIALLLLSKKKGSSGTRRGYWLICNTRPSLTRAGRCHHHRTNETEVLQLCSHPVVGWPNAPPGVSGLRSIQMASIRAEGHLHGSGLVRAFFTVVPRRRGAISRAWALVGSRHPLAVTLYEIRRLASVALRGSLFF